MARHRGGVDRGLQIDRRDRHAEIDARATFDGAAHRLLGAAGGRDADELALPMGAGKPSPVSSVDVARAVAAILDDPAPHIGHIYDLTGPESAHLDDYARVFSEALGRAIRYRDVPTSEWSEKLRAAGLSEHG